MKKWISGVLASFLILAFCMGLANAEKNELIEKAVEKAIKDAPLAERAAALKKYGFPKEVIEKYTAYEHGILLIYKNCASSSLKWGIDSSNSEYSRGVKKIKLEPADVRAVLFDINTEGPYWFPPYKPAPLRVTAFLSVIEIASLKDGKLTSQREQVSWFLSKKYSKPNPLSLRLWQNPAYYLSKVQEIIESEAPFCVGKDGSTETAVEIFASIEPSAKVVDEDPYAKPSNWGFEDDD